MNETKKIKLMN